MKKFLLSAVLMVFLALSPIAGLCQQSEKGFIESFTDGIAYVVLKAAWPTAHYENCEFERVSSLGGCGKLFKFKINAKSAYTGGSIWLQVIVELDSDYDIVDIRYGDYKAFWPPGTARKALQALGESNRN